MISNILFDLDGTLTDSRDGVIGCFQYALNEMGCPSCGESELLPFIGLPIRTIFAAFLGPDDGAISQAIDLYREKYAEIGITANRIFPGVTEALRALHGNSYLIYIVTLKNKVDAGKVAAHFCLDKWIRGVYGPDLTEYPEDKAELVKSVLSDFSLAPEETVMVGDRKEDIISGRSNGTLTIGVTYGYGSEEEIINATPDYICRQSTDILPAIRFFGRKK